MKLLKTEIVPPQQFILQPQNLVSVSDAHVQENFFFASLIIYDLLKSICSETPTHLVNKLKLFFMFHERNFALETITFVQK